MVVYRHGGQTWTGDAAAAGAEEWDQASPERTYVHDTLLTASGSSRTLDDPHQQ